MDDQQPTFNQQYSNPYPFDTDMMKRSMESVAGPDSNKKARWSPTSSFPAPTGTQSQAAPPPSARQPSFENYGYGGFGPNNGQGQQQSQQQQQQPQGQQQQQLYSTPAPLTLNASNLAPNTNSAAGGGVSPNTLFAPGQNGGLNTPFTAQTPYSAMFPGYGMNMMGMMGGYGFSPQAGTFPQQGFQPQNAQSLTSLNIPAAQGYSPAVAAAAAAAAGNQTGRTVYVGNLPSDASVDELLNLVHFGPLESVRVLPEKSCVFISFLDGATAAAFHADATVKKLALHGQELKIGWGKASPVPSQVMLSITQSNASRNVYLGGLDENMTEEQLRDDLSRFGLIDQVKIVRDKNIGFVHFLSISVATKVVATLPTEPAWAGKRVNYGKDRCAYVPKSQQAAQQAAQVAAAQSLVAQAQAQTAAQGLFPPFTPYDQTTMPTTPASTAMAMMAAAAAGAGSPGGVASAMNRTVYLGNIHPETTTEDLCNAIRGGVLQSIRYMQDKHIAFVTFIDPTAAFTFFQVASFQGLTLNNRRLKIGWGKNSGPLPPALALAVHSGATRNVYVGNIEDFELFSEDRLKKDFGEFGDIELVNFLKEKNCAFVNFTNISNAIKAIDSIKNKPEYANLRIAHGKDRCANPPRSGPQGGGGGRRGGAGVSPGGGEGLEGELYAEPTDAVVLGQDDHMQDHEVTNGNGHVEVADDQVPQPEQH